LDIADQIVDQGGEGVVVRNPRAKYGIGRTWDVLRWVPQAPAKNRI
jgi:ATP-dependent DNA ligase